MADEIDIPKECTGALLRTKDIGILGTAPIRENLYRRPGRPKRIAETADPAYKTAPVAPVEAINAPTEPPAPITTPEPPTTPVTPQNAPEEGIQRKKAKKQKPMVPLYLMADFYNSRKAYRENFDRIMEVIGTDLSGAGSREHIRLLKIERKLDHQQAAIMKDLNLFAGNPCVLNSTMGCDTCTGYYRKVTDRPGKGSKRYEMCGSGVADASRCQLIQKEADARKSKKVPML